MEEKEKFTFEANQKQIEKFLLFMYTVYTVFFINTLKNLGGSMDFIIVDIVCLMNMLPIHLKFWIRMERLLAI